MNANTALKIVGATAKVAVIAASAVKIYVFAKMAHAISKVDANNTNNN
jgi:hypothetical protein